LPGEGAEGDGGVGPGLGGGHCGGDVMWEVLDENWVSEIYVVGR
jgi:hypothetical protein